MAFSNKSILITAVIVSLIAGLLGGLGGFYLTQSGVLKLGGGPSVAVTENGTSTPPGVQPDFRPQTTQEQRIVQVVNRSVKSVVSVVITKNLPVYERVFRNPFADDPFFRQFFGDNFGGLQVPELRQKGTEKRKVGAGSGFIVDSQKGLIVTNRHVVADEEADYTVVLNDGTKLSAQVLARDPIQDIAVLKVKPDNLPPALPLGDAQELQIGQSVIAIGNALGEFSNTVSVGVVSGLSRSLTASGPGGAESLQGVIQTDAAVNPGNSGGPLLNLKGEVVGVNTAVAQGAENIGFAIPINEVKKDLRQVEAKGKITAPFLGVRYITITPELAKQEKLPRDYGALIVRGEQPGQVAVVPGSPADKAGLRENDIILEFAGEKITADNPLFAIIVRFSPGDKVKLKVYRQGKEFETEVELGER